MERKRLIAAGVTLAGAALAHEAIVRGGYGLLHFLSAGHPLTWTAALNAAGLIGLVVGLYFLLLPPDKSARELELDRLVANIQNAMVDLRASSERSTNSVFGEIISIYVSLDKLGVSTPCTISLSSAPLAFSHARKYLAGILPLIRDGHIAVARREAIPLIESVGAIPAYPRRIRDWLTPWKPRHRVAVPS